MAEKKKGEKKKREKEKEKKIHLLFSTDDDGFSFLNPGLPVR